MRQKRFFVSAIPSELYCFLRVFFLNLVLIFNDISVTFLSYTFLDSNLLQVILIIVNVTDKFNLFTLLFKDYSR